MTGSTISSISAAITSPPVSIAPPGPRPSRPGPRSPAWPLGHRPSCDRPSCALSRPEPIKLTVPSRVRRRAALLPRSGPGCHPWDPATTWPPLAPSLVLENLDQGERRIADHLVKLLVLIVVAARMQSPEAAHQRLIAFARFVGLGLSRRWSGSSRRD